MKTLTKSFPIFLNLKASRPRAFLYRLSISGLMTSQASPKRASQAGETVCFFPGLIASAKCAESNAGLPDLYRFVFEFA